MSLPARGNDAAKSACHLRSGRRRVHARSQRGVTKLGHQHSLPGWAPLPIGSLPSKPMFSRGLDHKLVAQGNHAFKSACLSRSCSYSACTRFRRHHAHGHARFDEPAFILELISGRHQTDLLRLPQRLCSDEPITPTHTNLNLAAQIKLRPACSRAVGSAHALEPWPFPRR